MNSSHRKADWTTVMFTLATSCLVYNLFAHIIYLAIGIHILLTVS